MRKHIACLDGIRGGLALWVFFGHICFAVGATIPLVSSPALAVDLFMLISGFLMMYHYSNYTLSSGRVIGDASTTFQWPEAKKFWIRRFFRIAPLYYFLLPISFVIGTEFQTWVKNIEAAFPPPWIDALNAYVSPTDHSFSIQNLLSHITFVFGAFPQYASNNSLPDWSLSLEMQFYFVFPLLLVFFKPSRVFYVLAIAILAVLTFEKLFGLYLDNGLLGNYPQPSFLPFKFHVFVAGMALGYLCKYVDRKILLRSPYWLVFLLPLLLLNKYVIIIALSIAVLVLSQHKLVLAINGLLEKKLFRFLGDISYGVYLVHLPIAYFVVQQLLAWDHFHAIGALSRFAVASSISLTIIIPVAYLLHQAIEIPGINLGKRLTSNRDVKHVPSIGTGQ
ncbi:Peptidoglycan/LPS O-acetylase OafA/YrhL, contains acyltransferase and SGNH-hydrolase domains [Thiothrix caldifontis]|uniref:Peptidoglycan/LPS O-acetylase OafA/YrhL, contains acyltransferase and SGNH-hydrolase domains n=1 Tax=Thiothrix caldifontis TaxID=525918 RepID=A0A1H4E0L9_9GAMM|nr:acyltransferase [Thiothrix caldifontis]SEA77962.1 Peptidoglycan/LPS O-acetylase OafA/YrhL, contains acyltransferase and SGNH-hydrolase domains [Thiothrix caldifontis]